MKAFKKILINSLVGAIALFFYNIIGAYFGLSIGLNLFNSLTVGLLGVPGFATLLILKLL